MANKTYYEKLKDPRWQKKRLSILDLHDFQCSNCGDTKSTLHVHHKFYKKNYEPWDYTESELTCLCEQCHSDETLLDNEIERVFREFKEWDMNKLSLLGYLQGCLFGSSPFHEEIKVIDLFHAQGIANALEITGDECSAQAVIEILINDVLYYKEFCKKYRPALFKRRYGG